MSDICYKKNYLRKVIAKVDFAQPLTDLSGESLLATINEIKKRFPISEQRTASIQGVEIIKKEITHSVSEFPEWRFHSSDRKKSLVLNQHFIEILLTEYESENNFQQDLIAPISSIISTRPSTIVSRTGIRFINVFDFDELSEFNAIKDYFSDSIVCPITSIKDSQKSIRSFLINEFMEGEIKWKVQTGYFNPDYPALIKKHHFVIDIDAYIDFPHSINDVRQYFANFHKVIQSTFESLIKDKLREEVLNA